MDFNAMLSPEDAEIHAKKIVNDLAGLPSRHALQVLASALELIISQQTVKADLKTVKKEVPRILLRRGGIHKIARYPEMKAFVDAIDKPTTLREIREQLIEKFGAARVPSKSAIHRYLQARAGGE